jgi:hypothetical protein
MTYPEFIFNHQVNEHKYVKQLAKLQRELARPELNPFTEHLLDRLMDKVSIEDHIFERGRDVKLVPPLSKRIKKNSQPYQDKIGNSSTGRAQRAAFAEFTTKNRQVRDKYLKLGDFAKTPGGEFTEVQICGKTPFELEIRPVPDIQTYGLDGSGLSPRRHDGLPAAARREAAPREYPQVTRTAQTGRREREAPDRRAAARPAATRRSETQFAAGDEGRTARSRAEQGAAEAVLQDQLRSAELPR